MLFGHVDQIASSTTGSTAKFALGSAGRGNTTFRSRSFRRVFFGPVHTALAKSDFALGRIDPQYANFDVIADLDVLFGILDLRVRVRVR